MRMKWEADLPIRIIKKKKGKAKDLMASCCC